MSHNKWCCVCDNSTTGPMLKLAHKRTKILKECILTQSLLAMNRDLNSDSIEHQQPGPRTLPWTHWPHSGLLSITTSLFTLIQHQENTINARRTPNMSKTQSQSGLKNVLPSFRTTRRKIEIGWCMCVMTLSGEFFSNLRSRTFGKPLCIVLRCLCDNI